MKFVQKAKYFVAGVVASVLLATGVAKAVIEVPTLFKEGYTISANSFNALFKEVYQWLDGYTSSDDILGSWQCTSRAAIDPFGGELIQAGWSNAGDGLTMTITQRVEFSKVKDVYWMQSEKYPLNLAQYHAAGWNTGIRDTTRLLTRFVLIDNSIYTSPAAQHTPVGITRMSNGSFSMAGMYDTRTNCKRIADTPKINPLK